MKKTCLSKFPAPLAIATAAMMTTAFAQTPAGAVPTLNAEREPVLPQADPQKLPAVFHCITGKDRTGWAAVVRVLKQPELIAEEVAKQETSADAQRTEVGQRMAIIDVALAKCDREVQRWADAYAGEVINLVELQAYRADIETRRQSLLAEHAACQRQLDAIRVALQEVEALTAYCARVHQCLQAFDHAEKLGPYRHSISG